MKLKNVNWSDILGTVGTLLSVAAMVCSNVSQKNEIKKAANEAVKEALKNH